VGRAGVGSAYKTPPRVVPHSGKFGDDITKSQSEVSSHVLQDDDARSKRIDGSGNERPEVSLIAAPFPLPGVTEWLARIPPSEDVNRLNLCPVDEGDVPEVRGDRMMRGEDLACGRFNLRIPRDATAEVLLRGEVQSTVSAE
jgi:hypothetical protein